MDITTESAQRYVGGQMEIQNPKEGYCYRGEVESISVDGSMLKVIFAWVAKAIGYPPLPKDWEVDDDREYEMDLDICGVADIGEGRTCIQCTYIGETVVLFLPDGNNLDPSKVKGLQL